MDRNPRKKWGKGYSKPPKEEIHVKAVKEEIPAGYDEYISLLQQRNRVLKRLKEKDSKQIDLERKEQGFTLYVNGANTRGRYTPQKTPSPRAVIKSKPKPKTAGDYGRTDGDNYGYDEYASRGKTAPSKVQRKNWLAGSIQIKTDEGQKVKLKAPDVMTGNYEDDFEEYVSESYQVHSDEENPIDSEEEDQEKMSAHMAMIVEGSDSGSDIEIDASKYDKSPMRMSDETEEVQEEINEQLMLSIDDVKKLRESMEMHASIQQSIAEEISSDEDAPIKTSPIPEEVDEEEELPVASEETEEIQPDDYIVLEFAPNKREERSLSAPRRSESDLQNKKQQEQPKPEKIDHRKAPERQSADKPEELVFTAGPKKKVNRPLSAHRKSKETVIDTTADTQAVLQALQAENEEAEKFVRDTRSAPSRQSQLPNSTPLPKPSGEPRPSSSKSSLLRNEEASQKGDGLQSGDSTEKSPSQLTEEKLTKVLKKVLQMDGKQQKKLLKALHKIEDSTSANNSPRVPASTEDKKLTGVSGTNFEQPSSTEKPVKFVLDISMEILSNWGHPNRVGLTEIQIFDLEGNKFDLASSDVAVHGTDKEKGNLECLFNGRFKTTKERNMWSSSFRPGQPVKFAFTVQRKDSDQQSFGVSKIRIWNFNKSLNELGVGVKDVRILVDGTMIFEGEIDKGCGNQVFDYSKSIPIQTKPEDVQTDNKVKKSAMEVRTSQQQRKTKTKDSVKESTRESVRESLPPRSETRILNYSTGSLQLPVVDDSPEKPTQSVVYSEDVKDCKPSAEENRPHSPKLSKKMAARLDGSTPEPQSPRKSDSEPKFSQAKPNLKKSKPAVQESVINSTDDLSMLQKIREITRTSSRGSNSGRSSASSRGHGSPRPKWLQSDQDPSKPADKPKWLKSDDVDVAFDGPPESRATSRADASKVDSRSVSRGARKINIDDELKDWPQKGEDHLPTVLDDEAPKQGRRSVLKTPDKVADDQEELRWRQRNPSLDSDHEDGDQTPMKQIKANRDKWRVQQELNLEASWTSLNLFDKSHRGRISTDVEGDVLDDYLQQEKRKLAGEEAIEEDTNEEIEDFIIPELPQGRTLVISIKSTWGDRHYIGLNGIEIFSSTGEPVSVEKIVADPPDINVLQEYGQDPRVVSNLIDGVNRTRDDIHMWLAPFTMGQRNSITITFDKPCQIAMIRIWNYNKSRIHSYRGAKDIEMTLDGEFVFKGEIARACGGVMGGTEAFGDTILFTVNEDILEAVSRHDEAYETDEFSDDDWEDDVPFERPRTADSEERPFTSAVGSRPAKDLSSVPAPVPEEVNVEPDCSHISVEGDLVIYTGQCLKLNFVSTWGDVHYLGLTGLEVVGKDGDSYPITMAMIDANPRDLHVLPGYERDDRTLDKLIDGVNVTMSDEHMWMVPYAKGQNHVVTINFNVPVSMVAVRIWNYNKSPEDTYRGAKVMHATLDDKVISPLDGYLIRKGPGNCFFDFMQEIAFSQLAPQVIFPSGHVDTTRQSQVLSDEPSQEYESVQMPSGFIYQLQLFSTWGDPYYVGLNGLEVYDESGNKIDLLENSIAAYPDSVNVLENVSNDTRTPDKLINGINDTTDGRNMWLAPMLPGLLNRVFIIFDTPRTISMIKLWNYSKTPARGVKDFALLVDDLLVYSGTLGRVEQISRGILPTCDLPQPYHTILFTQDKEIARRERHTVITKQDGDQDIQLTNDMRVVGHFTDPKQAHSRRPVNQALRPTTSVTDRGGNKRR